MDDDSSEDDGQNEKTWRPADAAPAAVGAAATTAALFAGAPPESGAFIGLGASQLASAIQPSLERRFRRFMGQLLRPWEHVDDPADRFWRHVKEREIAQEAVLAGLARLRDLLDPTVAASLGKLVQAYVAAERLPDRFFRDASGVLIDLAPGELFDLHRLLDFLFRTQVHRVRVTVASVAEISVSIRSRGPLRASPCSRSTTNSLRPRGKPCILCGCWRDTGSAQRHRAIGIGVRFRRRWSW